MGKSNRQRLPEHPAKQYGSAGSCIYCGSTKQLSNEHIVAYSIGGNWLLPKSSCPGCSRITGAFEGEFSRTILGPLRMLYEMPTRRPKDRPKHLPLKVKYPASVDWEVAQVDRSICPFLITLPLYPLPDAVTGIEGEGNRNAATASFWIRGGGFWDDKDAHLQWLCNMLGAVEVMPIGTVNTEPFCLTLAKVAHSFASAELGIDAFEPFLCDMIRNRDLSNRALFIGGGEGNELPSAELHEVGFDDSIGVDPNIIVVRVRLFAILGTPTYHIAVGRRI